MLKGELNLKKSRYSETQIVKVLKEVETGKLVKDVCREYGISDATYYNWKSKYGGMETSDVKRLKELETENQHLKQMKKYFGNTGILLSKLSLILVFFINFTVIYSDVTICRIFSFKNIVNELI